MNNLQETRVARLSGLDGSIGNLEFEQVAGGPYGQMAARIIVELELPVFLPMGKSVPYSMNELSRVMELEGNQTVIVWGKKPGEARRLVAYNTGTPYRSYPEDLLLKVENVTPIDGSPPLPIPDETTWMHDTIAVMPSEQRRGIGKALINLMVPYAREKGCTTWAVFLSLHESSKSKEMYDNHPIFKNIQEADGMVEGIVPHRGTTVTYRLYDLGKR
jgi:GNAT superfamily N-acetyltransferase